MPVSLPQFCSVLAHELRTPLSVLQGCVRLLQPARDASHPETAMLAAMLEATGRLTTLSRQASDLGGWLQSLPTGAPRLAVSAHALEQGLVERLNGRHVVITGRDASTQPADNSDKPGGQHQMLTSAIETIADAVARESGAPSAILHLDAAHQGQMPIRVQPSSIHPQLRDRPPRNQPNQGLFTQGGVGLALVVASHVLDAYGASVEHLGTDSSLVLRVPLDGDLS